MFRTIQSFWILCVCHLSHVNLTTSAFTDKGSYNSGKAPLHSQAVLFYVMPYGASECPFNSSPLFHEGCMSLLPYMDSSVVSRRQFFRLSFAIHLVADICTLQENRFPPQWPLPPCVLTCQISHNASTHTYVLQKTTLNVYPRVIWQKLRLPKSPDRHSVIWLNINIKQLACCEYIPWTYWCQTFQSILLCLCLSVWIVVEVTVLPCTLSKQWCSIYVRETETECATSTVSPQNPHYGPHFTTASANRYWLDTSAPLYCSC